MHYKGENKMNKKEGIVSETKAIQKKLTERKTVLQSFFQTASVEFKDSTGESLKTTMKYCCDYNL